VLGITMAGVAEAMALGESLRDEQSWGGKLDFSAVIKLYRAEKS